MCRKLIYLISFATLLIAAGSVQARTTVTTADSNGADTYVSNDSQQGPTTNWGGEVRIRAFRQLADTRSKTGYIRFDLSDVYGDMTGATLTFEATYLKGSAKSVNVYGLTDETLDSWVESTINYNNAPGMLPATLGNYALDLTKLVLLGTITTPAAGPAYPFRFSSDTVNLNLDSFLNADTNKLVTFVFIGTNNESEIASKEHATFLEPTLTLPNALIPPATYPNPTSGSMVTSTTVTLQWQAGSFAATHKIYFGTNFSDVNSGSPGVYVGEQNRDANSCDVSGLIFGTTYYWRIDEVNGPPDYTVYKGSVWNFRVLPLLNWNPTPSDSANYVAPKMTLRWRAGSGAVQGHNVYLGSNFNDVNNATTGSTVLPFRKFLTPTADPNWNPAKDGVALGFNKTYYWRVDAVQSTSPQTIYKGTVWSFTTVPNPPTEPNLVGWWKLDGDVSDSGYGCNGTAYGNPLPTYVAGAAYGGGVPPPDNNAIYLLGTTGAAPNQYVELPIGSVLSTLTNATFAVWVNRIPTPGEQKWHRIFDFGTGGTNYMFLAPQRSSSPPTHFEITTGGVTQRVTWGPYSAAGTTITPDEWHHLAVTISDPNAAGFRTFRLYVDSQQVGVNPQATLTPSSLGVTTNNWLGRAQGWTGTLDPALFRGYLDDLRIYDRLLSEREIRAIITPLTAWQPSPADGAIDVPLETTLRWIQGKMAVKHDVYFSDNWDDVNNAASSDPNGPDKVYKGRQDPNNYGPIILNELGQTYYWRIDEVNDPNIWRGNIWRFTTRDYLVVDDFESYTNSDPNIIYKTWKDGVGYSPGNGTGSQAGYRDPNYAEVTNFHWGRQSMPVDYNNTKSPYYSEVDRTFAPTQDWTAYGVKALSLWLRGYPVSVGSFVESPPGTYTMTASGTDIYQVPDLRRPSRFHDEFRYAYMQVSGDYAIAVKVESITNTDPWAKAGVMIRDSADANSAHVMTCITPSSGVSFQYRTTAGGANGTSTTQAGLTVPYWVSLTRQGNSFTAGYSSSGPTGEPNNWTTLASTSITMTDPVCIGLSLTAHNATATCTAVFSNVRLYTVNFDGTLNPVIPLPPWTSHQDIGIKSNVAAPVYVTLYDSSAKSATVNHDDPNIALATSYQEWLIPLARFTSLNPSLDLKNIQKITLGTGGADNRGTGTLYFDDVRLYIPRCMAGRPGPAADLTGSDCMVDYSDLQLLTNNWLLTPQNPAIDMNENGTIDLRDYAVLASMWLEEILWPPSVTNVWAYELKNDANCYDPGPPRDANDLHLEFNGEVYLIDTGPFTSLTGNGTSKITLSAGAVPANGRTIIRFGSTGGEKTLNKWWWTASRVRISKEMAGVGPSCKKIN